MPLEIFNGDQSRKYLDRVYLLRKGPLPAEEEKRAEFFWKSLGFLSPQACEELDALLAKYFKPPCNHPWIILEKETCPPEHFARRICHECKAFLGFEPFPDDQSVKAQCERLRGTGKLLTWENEFLHAIADQRRLTDGQRKTLDKISSRLEGNHAKDGLPRGSL